MTVVAAGDAGRPVDVLVGGESRGSGVPRRWKVAGLVLVLLGAVGVVGRAVVADRAEQRAEEAAFAVLDRVHLQGTFGAVYGFFDGGVGYVLSAEVSVSVVGGQRGGDRVTGLRFEGEGLTPRVADLSGLAELPATLRAEADVDCDEVAVGRYPESVSVVLDVVPRSGVTHSQHLPVETKDLREASLAACDLPDPDARTGVEVQGAANGTLLLLVQTVQRSRQPVALEAVTVPGFEVRPNGDQNLVTSLPPGTGGVFGFTVRVADCAMARGSTTTTVRLRVGDAPETRVASTEVSQPQPGGMSAAQLLQRLVNLTCWTARRSS